MIDARGQPARREIAETARSMLAGSVTFIEGARAIFALTSAAQIERDPDILPFAGIVSETDALPFGRIRDLWNADALVALQPEIERKERWAQNFGRPYCENLIRRFGSGD